MFLAFWILIATLHPVSYIPFPSLKREREKAKRISRQVKCRQAVCRAGAFCYQMPGGDGGGGAGGKVVLVFYWLQALFIFSATLNLFGFLSNTWSKEVKSYCKRNEKSHPLSNAYLLGDLRDVCQYNTHI